MTTYMFDASELTPQTAKSIGIYRYAVGLAGDLARLLRPGEQLLLVCNGDNLADFAAAASSERVRTVCVRPAMPGQLWRQWWMRAGCAGFVRRHGVQVYLSPKGFIPRSLAWPASVSRVCVIHDLIPFWYFQRHPGYFGRLETALVGGAFRHALARADHIVAISSSTLQALLQEGVARDKVSLVLNGVDPVPQTRAQPSLPAVLAGQRFIFAMASGLPHKNLQGVLAGYAAYRREAGPAALPLALCGASDVKDAGVLALGRVSDAELAALYAQAEIFLFMSLIEGFGYPPIEALRVGTPVLCSDLPVFREVCVDMARYTDPTQADAIGHALVTALREPWGPAPRRQLAERAGQRIAQGLSWSQCAAGVLHVLRRAGKVPAPVLDLA